MMPDFFIYRNINPEVLPTFGFKIHVSATIHNYLKIFEIVEPLLNSLNIPFKYINGYDNIFHNFSVNEELPESGKFFTIYPQNHQKFLHLLDLLYHSIPKNLDGVYIMSDRNYKDSKVIFYRFGTIKYDIYQTENGIPTLTGPNGEKWQDYQKPYFDLPNWIDDIQPPNIIENSYLSSNYVVTSMVTGNNGGNVYKGQKINNHRGVILKEVRPNILFFENIEKQTLRENEYQLSSKLNKYVAQPIEYTSEWINKYYIYKEIDGKSLFDYLKQYTIFSYSSISQNDIYENLVKFKRFLNMIEKLMKLFKYFHDNDVILHDVHSNNFIVDINENVFFIDLEHSYQTTSRPISGIFHDVALKEWNGLEGKQADCHKLANLILYLIAKLQVKTEENFDSTLLNNLLQNYGIETNICEVIEFLLSPKANINDAIDMLQKVYSNLSNIKFCLSKFENYQAINLSSNSNKIMDYLKNNSEGDPSFDVFKENLNDDNYIKLLIDSEKKYGLDGLLGKTLMYHLSLSDDVKDYAVQTVINNLAFTSYGRMIPLKDGNASPYLNNGNAGFIQSLIILDKQKYRDLIIELADTLDFEFAQYPFYYNGMLGIAETLLIVYKDFYKKDKYLYLAEKLLVNTSFYIEKTNVDYIPFLRVLKLYEEAQNAAST